MTDLPPASPDAAASPQADPPAAVEASRPYVTYAILAILVGGFLLEIVFSVDPVEIGSMLGISPRTLVLLGGILPPAVTIDGEWYRLLTAPLLHADVLHLLLNGIVLYFVGVGLEALTGRAWFAAIYFIGGVGGSLLSLAFGSANVVSVGASGAITALIAALTVLAFRFPAGEERRSLLISCGQMLIPALIPRSGPTGMSIDVAAHVGGAIAGALVAGLLMAIWRRDRERPPLVDAALAVAIAGLLATELGVFRTIRLYPEHRGQIEAAAVDVNDPIAVEAAAERGNVAAMNSIGVRFERGEGVPQDFARARQWYERAAQKGDVQAMHNLGALYANGKGVAQDVPKALVWLEKAANGGFAEAMFSIGFIHATGLGVPQDYPKAVQWFVRGADKGSVSAMRNLGILSEGGLGVAKDPAKARSWYEKAAEKGDAVAQTNLGALYHNGTGVPQDYAKARAYYEKAVAQGQPDAMRNLGTLYTQGHGVEQSYPKAAELFEKAVQAGDADASFSLAVFLDEGRGVTANFARAAQLLLQAAKGGVEAARQALDGEMADWNAATVAALKGELQRLGHAAGPASGPWDARAKRAAAAYLAQP